MPDGAMMRRPSEVRREMDVCLVNMPFAWVMIPSIGLGILHATLESAGIAATSVYANVLYFREVGIEKYQMIQNTKTQDGPGDWLFASMAFPEFNPDHKSYIRMFAERNNLLQNWEQGPLEEMLFALRQESVRFVRDMADRVLAMKPRIVGCTSTVQQHVSSLALLRVIRESAPEVVTMMGGANCEALMGLTTHKCFPWVDFVVSGEADGLIVPLVRSILEHGRELGEKELPEGVFAPVHRSAGYPGASNGGAEGPPRATGKPLSEQAVPNYDDYFEVLKSSGLQGKQVVPGIPIQTARGCWWGRRKPCTFCGLNGHGKGFHSKEPSQVLREMDLLSKRYGLNRFETVDNIIDMRYFTTLLPKLIRAGSPYSIFYETKSSLNRRQVELLRRAGVIWIQPGVESLHSEVLRLMNKGCKAFHNVRLLKWCRQYGVRAGWNILHDFPGEDDVWYSEMAQLVPLLTHLQPPGTMTPIRFDRFSHYHVRADEYGLKLKPAPLSKFLYPLTEEELPDLVYSFKNEAQVACPEDSFLALLMVRTGLNTFRRRAREWVHAWNECRPVLEMEVTPSALHIKDTRPAAAAPEYVLTRLEREIYLACENGRKTMYLLENFSKDRKKTESVIEGLLERKLAIALDGRLLSLAVHAPCPEMPELEDFPGGTVLPSSEDGA